MSDGRLSDDGVKGIHCLVSTLGLVWNKHTSCWKNVSILVIPVIFYSQSCLDQETAKGRFGFESSCHPSTTHGGGFTLSLLLLNIQQGSCKNQFYSLWLDPTGNRTRVYHFSSRPIYHWSVSNFYGVSILWRHALTHRHWHEQFFLSKNSLTY